MNRAVEPHDSGVGHTPSQRVANAVIEAAALLRTRLGTDCPFAITVLRNDDGSIPTTTVISKAGGYRQTDFTDALQRTGASDRELTDALHHARHLGIFR